MPPLPPLFGSCVAGGLSFLVLVVTVINNRELRADTGLSKQEQWLLLLWRVLLGTLDPLRSPGSGPLYGKEEIEQSTNPWW